MYPISTPIRLFLTNNQYFSYIFTQFPPLYVPIKFTCVPNFHPYFSSQGFLSWIFWYIPKKFYNIPIKNNRQRFSHHSTLCTIYVSMCIILQFQNYTYPISTPKHNIYTLFLYKWLFIRTLTRFTVYIVSIILMYPISTPTTNLYILKVFNTVYSVHRVNYSHVPNFHPKYF